MRTINLLYLIYMPERWKNALAALHRNRSGLLLILLVWLAVFSRTLTGQAVYFLDDLKIIYYPLEHVYAEFQANLALPVWSPLFGFGHPLIAWGQLGFFTPLHVMLRALQLHPLALLQVSITAYFLAGSAGMYAFLRRSSLAPIAAALGGILYAYTGFHIGHLNHVNFYTATMLLPCLLLAVGRLLQRPTAAGSALVALAGAAMALSGQPQVVLYSFIIAALYAAIAIADRLIAAPARTSYLLKAGISFAAAALVALLLASWAILPLLEFLPLTERADDGTIAELLDFSYPPYNTITLVLPYFFGGHNDYWGPKGFQELAAFTGIIPLLLAAAALFDWRRRRSLRLLGALLIASALLLAAGRYSPLYRTLIEQRIITNLNIPGRFVFYFTTGTALLASLAVDELLQASRRRRAGLLAAGVLLITLLLAPVVLAAQELPALAGRLAEVAAAMPLELSLLAAGLIAALAALLWPARRAAAWQWLTVSLAAATLIIFGWHFNPLTPRAIAFTPSPASVTLQQAAAPLPPRLYAAPTLLRSTETATARTDPIAPDLTVAWPLLAAEPNFTCINLPVFASQDSRGRVTFRIFADLAEPPLRTVHLDTQGLATFDQTLCFEPIANSAGQTFHIVASSTDETQLRLFARPEDNPEKQARIARIAQPTYADVLAARKPIAILASPAYTSTADVESALLMRHVNAAAGASSARWIGALSIRDYRNFIEEFFANDKDEPFDGDGRHAIEANQRLVNLAGVTHLIQNLTAASDERMLTAGFIRRGRWPIGAGDIVLYENPAALPKAFVVPNAIWQPAADEVRAALHDPQFDPASTALLAGPAPPALPLAGIESAPATAKITVYEPTRVEVQVSAGKESVLVVTDATTPQWHTFIDGQPAPHYTAYSIFKAAIVPAGEHTVTFEYDSPAINRSKAFSLAGLALALALFTAGPLKRRLN